VDHVQDGLPIISSGVLKPRSLAMARLAKMNLLSE